MNKEDLKKSKLFDPEKPFFALGVVRWSIRSIVLISAATTLTIAAHENPVLVLSSKGFNFAIEVFKVPLGTLALLIPIVAVLAGNHRSEQTIRIVDELLVVPCSPCN